MAKFSLIIPVYNDRLNLRVCLDTVRAQTFDDWECLCIDDGSTDESGEILEEYAVADPRFRVFHKPNGGIASARNFGIENARGDWLMFMDHDDGIVASLFENLARVEGLEKRPFDVMRFGFDGFAENVDLANLLKKDMRGTGEYAYDDMSRSLGYKYMTGCMWRYAYRRETLGDIRVKNYLPGEDMVYQAEIFARSRGCVEIPELGYCYRCWSGSTSQQRLTLSKFVDQRRYSLAMIKAFVESGKTVHPFIYHYLSVKLTETVEGIRLLDAKDRPAAWEAFYEGLREATKYRVFSFWPTFVLHSCLIIRLRAWAWLVCVVPYRLKRLGLDRALPRRILACFRR